VTEINRIEELARLFVFIADSDFHGHYPVYEQLARSIATDHELLSFIDGASAANTRRGRVPLLFFAATHDVVLRFPDSELFRCYRGESDADLLAEFRQMVLDFSEVILSNMRTRSVQTNEVGRSAVLVPAFARATRDVTSPVAFVEIGPSAGLNLFFDQFAITVERNRTVLERTGPRQSTVQLVCEVRGSIIPTFQSTAPLQGQRTGIDPNPIDVTNPDESRWLAACVWPGSPDRPQRLAAALTIAKEHPPQLVQGDAVAELPALISTISADQHLVVFSTWALAYINEEGRRSLTNALDAIGATRDCDLVCFEEPRFLEWLPPVTDGVSSFDPGTGTPTALGLRSWRSGNRESTALAVAHPHGRWIHWLEDVHG